MADEFNPQGVDQTPQNGQTPNPGDTSEQTLNTEHSEAEGAQPATQVLPAQTAAQPDTTATTAIDPVPDYAAAKGESTVVSSAPAAPAGAAVPNAGQSEAPTAPLYRPAPEYGAYGPTPTAPAQNTPNASSQPAFNGQATQPLPFGQTAQPQPGQPGNRNPYFTNNPQPGQQPAQSGNGNPFNPQPQNSAQGNGNPFAPQGMFGAGAPNTPNGPSVPNGPSNGNPAQPQPAQRGGSKAVGIVVTAIIAAVVSAALCLGLGYAALTNGWINLPSTSSLSNVTSNKSGSGSATAKSGQAVDWTSVASSVSNSVVSIQTTLSNGTAKGSGAILDTEGHIVTNNHVISGAQSIAVTLANGTMYSAKLVGTDTTTDLAVIKLDNPPSDLTPVEFADSDKLAVGESVMAIGNPLGYDDTATTGIVSALNRPVSVTDDNNNEVVTNAVQIDAAINPGNSGGPTFNGAGQVIGINSSIASTATSSDTAGSIGIGFAIPSNLVKRVANEIISNGSVTHVALGVTIKSDTVEADGVTRGGATITKPSVGGSAVVSGGPADKAGLKEGDTIVAFNGNAVNNNYSLLGFVRAAALNDKATLTIVRDGKTMDVEVTLDQEESSVNGSSSSNGSNGNDSNGNGNGQNDQNGNGSDGYGDGGFSDPFGLW
ncbi:S1C family serine protease [Bifidobacterium scaligerum]|uniref:Peptidase n=1 Tax=Bifidobacterium scaligerum TaxID=2052656 RepID=A0A2M9HN84_9BIFI|nr:trypsin-like peptidase domain-containing protein [Bifidobacterium scaligerum]PJM78241.1 peptidase [Bifidobacterium scaligerum]